MQPLKVEFTKIFTKKLKKTDKKTLLKLRRRFTKKFDKILFEAGILERVSVSW